MTMETRKSGSWKRRARMQQMNDGKENGLTNAISKTGIGGKRGFILRGEKDMQKKNDKYGKKD